MLPTLLDPRPIKLLISHCAWQVNLATPSPVERYFERLSAMVTDSTLLPGELIHQRLLVAVRVHGQERRLKVSPSARPRFDALRARRSCGNTMGALVQYPRSVSPCITILLLISNL